MTVKLPALLPGGPGSPGLPVRPEGPAGPVGPFIPETTNSHSYAVKEHAVLQNVLQEWPKRGFFSPEGLLLCLEVFT